MIRNSGGCLVEGLAPAVDRVRASGVTVTERWYGQMGFGVAYRTDIHALHEHWKRVIVEAGESCGRTRRCVRCDFLTVAWSAPVTSRRARCCSRPAAFRATRSWSSGSSAGTPTACRSARTRAAPATASGWRRPPGRRRAAASVASTGTWCRDPLSAFEPEHYLPLTQYHSRYSILVDFRGRRFIDESLGDEVSNQLVLQLPGARAVLLCDERVRTEHVIGPPYPHGQVIDRFAVARSLGANLRLGRHDRRADRRGRGVGGRPGGPGADARRLRQRRRPGRAVAGRAGPAASSRRSTRSRCSRRSRSRSAACGSIRGGVCSTVTVGPCPACIAPAATRAACRARGMSPGWRWGSCSARAPWMQS